MNKRYISQSLKRQCEDILTLLLLAWLYFNLLIGIEYFVILYCLSWSVIAPAAVIGLMAFLLPRVLEIYNRFIGRAVYENMKEEFEREAFKLSKEEKIKMKTVLSDKVVLKKTLEALSGGYRGIVITKKANQKARQLRGSNSEKQPNNRKNLQESSFMTMIDLRSPRKFIIAFRDIAKPNSTTEKLEEHNGYSNLAFDLHIIHKSKIGGRKEKFSLTKVAIGAFTVCDYTQCISSTGLRKNMVALRERGKYEDSQGVLQRYRFEENKGEALSRRLSRVYAGVCNALGVDEVISMMNQVAVQVEERLHRRGKAHMDLKVDNVTISEDGKTFTVIDYPDEKELSGKKNPRATPAFGQLSSKHILTSSIVTSNQYVYLDSENRTERECHINDKERRAFKDLVDDFNRQSSREIKYLPIGVDTIFNDTWAAMYMAFVAFGEIANERRQTICQTMVFLLMKEMFNDYTRLYKKMHIETMGKGEGVFESKLKREMNKRWPLLGTINRLASQVSVVETQKLNFT